IESIFGHTDKQLLMYIGDHEADTLFARNIEQHLGSNCKVIAVAAAYSGAQPQHWNAQPDYVAHQVDDLIDIIGKYA
ncbi:HAD family hydrolase, partial [Vibrio harveyi]|nr:HAD family hydrolase [Vibrio harveyi]